MSAWSMTLNWQRHSLSIDLRAVFGKSICLQYCLFNPHVPGIKNLIFSKCQLMLLFCLLRGKCETTCKSLSLQESWKSKQALALGVWCFCCFLDRPPQVALDFDKFRCIFLLFLYLLLLQFQLKRGSHVKKKKFRKHIIEIEDKNWKVSITGHAKLFKIASFLCLMEKIKLLFFGSICSHKQ